MMNLLALALLLSSIATASFFSPAPNPDPQLVHEGHRLIVVEYERQLPRSSFAASGARDFVDEAKEKFLDAASVLPNVGQGLSQPQKEEHPDSGKEEASSVFADAKKKAVELEESASEAVKSAAQKAKQKAGEVGESTAAAVKDAAEKAKQKAALIEESTSDAIKTAAVKTMKKASNAAKSVGDTALKAGEDVAGNISASAEKTADMAVEAAGELRRNLTDILRLAWHLGRDAAWAAARSVAAVVYLLGFATAYGACVWVTFASSHVLASSLPRQQLGIVQSRVYPVYFRLVALGIGAAIAGHFLRWGRLPETERVQGYILMATLLAVLLNLLWLEPRATKAMFQRMKLDKEEGRGRDMADVDALPAKPTAPAGMPAVATTPVREAFAARKEASIERMAEVNQRLKRLNNYSSFLNMLTLMGLSWHLVHLAQRLVSAGELCK